VISNVIPRVVHQIWIGPRPRPARYMATWATVNPSFTIELWDDARCAGFGFRNADKIAQQPEWAGKADLMRYEILERHGGIFIDADAEALVPLPAWMLANDSFACWESEAVRPNLISNGYLGACPGNRLMGLLVAEAAHRDMRADRAWKTVGPALLTETVARYRYTDLKVYPSHFFIPEHYTGTKYVGQDTVYARQHWCSTRQSYEDLAAKDSK
jgi:mannosyltransferase OCH1-like enzyme